MQISLTSHTHSSSSRRNISSLRGFTLVELLISVAIIGIVVSIVLVKHTSFDSTVLLKGVAYEIGLSLREAQIKSVSAVRQGNDTENAYNFPYGISFTPYVSGGATGRSYTAFRYENSDITVDPRYVAPYAKGIATTTIGRSMRIVDVCVTVASVENCTTPTRLDVSFRRPEFKALFYAEGYSPQPVIESAKIKVDSGTIGGNVFVVEISRFGQISVVKQ